MGQSVRQAELFAAEDWRVLYRAFTNINFNASDPPSVNLALRQYIQQAYPEDFNDWIESSEFVALIDLLSWLSGLLAFRTDINARENFLDTAEARESILRLARFLSYQPHRNQAARGLVKLTTVQTDDDVIDSFGTNLNNAAINWNDPDNPDWFEQFTIVLNNAFIATNPFGIALKQGLVGGINTQLYRVNNSIGSTAVYSFNSLVNGSSTDFEVVNMDFDLNGGFFERDPDYNAAFNFCYRNDGNGNSSATTGFFFLFKQGTLNRSLFNLTVPIENRVIDIATPGINQTDVFVQTVSDTGNILQDWTQIPVLITDNITFNSVPATTRNIYQVVTRDNDQISLRFSDGRFGNVPIGNLRVWYRVSGGDGSQIRPQDMTNIQLVMPYLNRRGVQKNLFVTFSLQSVVTNSVPAETNDQVRRRAPQVFATQNRMVSGEDYNVFPLQSNLAVLLKAVNRTYAGHSRFIDLNDPTGTYQDTVVFADDGIFYTEPNNSYDEVPLSLNKTSEQIVEGNIQPKLQLQTTHDFLLSNLLTGDLQTSLTPIYWYQSTVSKFVDSGVFVTGNNGQPTPAVPIGLGVASDLAAHFITEGSLVKFTTPDNKPLWVSVASVSGLGTALGPTGLGAVTLTAAVPMGSRFVGVIPAIRTTLTTSEFTAIVSRLDDKFSFNLWYDYIALAWVVTDLTTTAPNAILVMHVEYISHIWRLRTSGLRYVFESENNVRWFFDQNSHAIDTQTGLEQIDTVRILSINPKPDAPTALGVNYDLSLLKQYVYPDGFTEPRRVQVTFADSNHDGIPDNPETFINLTLATAPANLLFWLMYTATDNNEYFAPLSGVIVFENATVRNNHTGTSGIVYFLLSDSTFWIWDVTITAANKWSQAASSSFKVANGRGGNGPVQYIAGSGTTTYQPAYFNFQWKHYAVSDHRIDPSPTNVVDIFVLDTSYDSQTRQWIANGSPIDSIPVSPTELDLSIEFAEFEQFKMFADEIVWRPVKYKFLFGVGADAELRAQFKVIPLPNTTLSSGEVQSQVIKAVNAFFATGNFDFGETFYYTELSAFIHKGLANIIGSVVIVPMAADAVFGDLFEIHCNSDEIFISTAQVSDVVIITSNTASNLRIT